MYQENPDSHSTMRVRVLLGHTVCLNGLVIFWKCYPDKDNKALILVFTWQIVLLRLSYQLKCSDLILNSFISIFFSYHNTKHAVSADLEKLSRFDYLLAVVIKVTNPKLIFLSAFKNYRSWMDRFQHRKSVKYFWMTFWNSEMFINKRHWER